MVDGLDKTNDNEDDDGRTTFQTFSFHNMNWTSSLAWRHGHSHGSPSFDQLQPLWMLKAVGSMKGCHVIPWLSLSSFSKNWSGTKKTWNGNVQTNVRTNNSKQSEGTTHKFEKVHPNFAINIAMEFHYFLLSAPPNWGRDMISKFRTLFLFLIVVGVPFSLLCLVS